MSDLALRVDDLSKSYRIAHAQEGQRVGRYKTLQEDLLALPRGLWSAVRGRNGAGHETIWALKDVSFEIKQGEVVGIIGRNGAGKSTLLKILSRITEPTEGRAEVYGRIGSLLEVGTGFHPELTGRENIFLSGAVLGMRRAEIAHKFDEIVAFAEVEKFIDTPVKFYSSGMYVRLAFAVAAHLEPEILLVDEVLAVGDAEFQKKCLGKMGEVAKEGRTVLFVSHNMSAVSRLCGRAILLKDGRGVYDGAAIDAIESYRSLESHRADERMEWINSGKDFPYADILRIKRFYVQDEAGGIPIGRIFSNKRYEVVVEVDIFKKNPNLVFFLAYYTEDVLLFLSDIHDVGEANMGRLRMGSRTLSAQLPVYLFTDRIYEVELSCVIHNQGWVILPDPARRIRLSVVKDTDASAMGYDGISHPFTGGVRPGLLAPVIKWRVS